MTCKRCGIQTPRLTPHQTHCPQCAVEVATLISIDEKRPDPVPVVEAARRLAADRMTREDVRQAIRDIPAAIAVLVGLWAFLALLFAVVPA